MYGNRHAESSLKNESTIESIMVSIRGTIHQIGPLKARKSVFHPCFETENRFRRISPGVGLRCKVGKHIPIKQHNETSRVRVIQERTQQLALPNKKPYISSRLSHSLILNTMDFLIELTTSKDQRIRIQQVRRKLDFLRGLLKV